MVVSKKQYTFGQFFDEIITTVDLRQYSNPRFPIALGKFEPSESFGLTSNCDNYLIKQALSSIYNFPKFLPACIIDLISICIESCKNNHIETYSRYVYLTFKNYVPSMLEMSGRRVDGFIDEKFCAAPSFQFIWFSGGSVTYSKSGFDVTSCDGTENSLLEIINKEKNYHDKDILKNYLYLTNSYHIYKTYRYKSAPTTFFKLIFTEEPI